MQYGFYRVNYPEENWNNLIYQLKADHKVRKGKLTIMKIYLATILTKKVYVLEIGK